MKVFLSYPSEQAPRAREIYGFLRSIGVDTWFDKESLIGGQNWDYERKRAQKAADLTVVICSPETVGRAGLIQREIKDALTLLQDKPLGHIYLVLMRTDEIVLPAELSGYQYIDLFRADWSFRLARSISLRYAQLNQDEPKELQSFVGASASASDIELKSINEQSGSGEFEADYFQFKLPGRYWEHINAEIAASVLGGYYDSKRHLKLFPLPDDRSTSWSVRLEKYFVTDDLVSLRFYDFTDLGGAHPSRGMYSKNFGGLDVGKISLDELFGRDDGVFKYIKSYCELDIKRQILDPISGNDDYDLTPHIGEEYQDRWTLFSQWNFNERGILINLSQYSGLPYVMGAFEVAIPWDFFKERVAEEVRMTPIGRFIAKDRF